MAHPSDLTVRQALLFHGVSEAGAFQFMQGQIVTDAADREALQVLMWRLVVQYGNAWSQLTPYHYSKSKGQRVR